MPWPSPPLLCIPKDANWVGRRRRPASQPACPSSHKFKLLISRASPQGTSNNTNLAGAVVVLDECDGDNKKPCPATAAANCIKCKLASSFVARVTFEIYFVRTTFMHINIHICIVGQDCTALLHELNSLGDLHIFNYIYCGR